MAHPAPAVLHVWPAPNDWHLPSLDPACLSAILHLQLAIPGRFQVTASTNPDSSPSGQLPYLDHGHYAPATLPSIVKYVAGSTPGTFPASDAPFTPNLDAHLTAAEKAQSVAWSAHAESTLGVLVAHSLYALAANWRGLTHPALSRMLPLPQRYYVPFCLRDAQKARLEAAGLWDVSGVEQEEPEAEKTFAERQKKTEEKHEHHFKNAFGRAKVIEQARASLDIFSSLLGDKHFIYSDRISSLDVHLAAHMLLLLDPPYPDPLLKTLLHESYPSLVDHARRVHGAAFPPGSAVLHIAPFMEHPLTSLIPWRKFGRSPRREILEEEAASAEKKFAKGRWTWIAAATLAVPLYFWLYMPKIVLVFQQDDAEEDDQTEKEEAAEEEEEDDDE